MQRHQASSFAPTPSMVLRPWPMPGSVRLQSSMCIGFVLQLMKPRGKRDLASFSCSTWCVTQLPGKRVQPALHCTASTLLCPASTQPCTALPCPACPACTGSLSLNNLSQGNWPHTIAPIRGALHLNATNVEILLQRMHSSARSSAQYFARQLPLEAEPNLAFVALYSFYIPS